MRQQQPGAGVSEYLSTLDLRLTPYLQILEEERIEKVAAAVA